MIMIERWINLLYFAAVIHVNSKNGGKFKLGDAVFEIFEKESL